MRKVNAEEGIACGTSFPEGNVTSLKLDLAHMSGYHTNAGRNQSYLSQDFFILILTVGDKLR